MAPRPAHDLLQPAGGELAACTTATISFNDLQTRAKDQAMLSSNTSILAGLTTYPGWQTTHRDCLGALRPVIPFPVCHPTGPLADKSHMRHAPTGGKDLLHTALISARSLRRSVWPMCVPQHVRPRLHAATPGSSDPVLSCATSTKPALPKKCHCSSRRGRVANPKRH